MAMERLQEIPVEEYSTPSPISVQLTTSLQEIVSLMREHGIRHVPVITGDNEVIGIISDRDVKLASGLREVNELVAEDVMSQIEAVLDPQTPLDQVAFEMARSKHGSAIIQGEGGEYLGIFTVTDALNALVDVLRGHVEGAS